VGRKLNLHPSSKTMLNDAPRPQFGVAQQRWGGGVPFVPPPRRFATARPFAPRRAAQRPAATMPPPPGHNLHKEKERDAAGFRVPGQGNGSSREKKQNNTLPDLEPDNFAK